LGVLLSEALAAPFLHCIDAEDHDWRFEIWQAGNRISAALGPPPASGLRPLAMRSSLRASAAAQRERHAY
jgi:hypothetical protein